MIEAVTLDFGNTLVPVTKAGLGAVVDETVAAMAARLGPFDTATVRGAWDEERQRQFREDVPQFREVDMALRIGRVLARLRGMPAPPADVPWNDAAAELLSDPGEVRWAVEVYSGAFVRAMPPDPAALDVITALAGRYRVAILSNWPVAATIDRFAEAAGWMPHLVAVVVSQRVGTIKPHPAIFAAALSALGDPAPARVVHVGDDWAADVVGAKRAGWCAAWLASRPADSPLPDSTPDASVVPDLVVGAISELPVALVALGEAGDSVD
jgi:HAD superfamily hydrolase (TIGR01509 family)